jgi:hypothetical protein
MEHDHKRQPVSDPPDPPDLIGAFLKDLADLSRRHGIWIRGVAGVHGDLPELYAAHGDEQGYIPYALNRGLGHVSQHFDVDSASQQWLTGDPRTRGEPPEPIRKLFTGK